MNEGRSVSLPHPVPAITDRDSEVAVQRRLCDRDAFIMEHLDLSDDEFVALAREELPEETLSLFVKQMVARRTDSADEALAQMVKIKHEAVEMLHRVRSRHYLDSFSVKDRLEHFYSTAMSERYHSSFMQPLHQQASWGERWQRVIHEAEPGFMTHEIATLINEASKSMPEFDLRWDEVPASADGFILFEQPLFIEHGPQPVSAMAWQITEAGVLVMFTTDREWKRLTEDPSFLTEQEQEQRDGPDLWAGVSETLPNWYGHIWMVDEIEVIEKTETGEQEKRTIPVEKLVRSPRDDAYLRFAVAFFRFLQQRIMVADDRSPVPRPIRRECERSGRSSSVRLYQLRRKMKAFPPDDDEHAEQRHLTVRYYVQPFWRQQWYPSIRQHRPICVVGHWRGPEDGPISESVRIVLVNR